MEIILDGETTCVKVRWESVPARTVLNISKVRIPGDTFLQERMTLPAPTPQAPESSVSSGAGPWRNYAPISLSSDPGPAGKRSLTPTPTLARPLRSQHAAADTNPEHGTQAYPTWQPS